PGLEVIEISCPASHDTYADHELALPTREVRDRVYGGQRFVRHIASEASWIAGARDLGIAAATAGLATVRVVRSVSSEPRSHDGDIAVAFVLAGEVGFVHGDRVDRLARADCVAVPAKLAHAFVEPSHDLELLEVVVSSV